MYNISAFTRDVDLSNYNDRDNYLTVNCAGYHLSITGSGMQYDREKGRADYLVMYSMGGREYILDNDMLMEISRGWICLYKPGEPQHMHYKMMESTLYWAHFTGSGCEELLEQCGMSSGRRYYAGENPDAVNAFIQIVNEIMLKRANYERISSSLLTYALLGLGRNIKEKNSDPESENKKKILDSVSYINLHFNRRITVDDLAAITSMSKYSYIRNFRRITGYTPVDYLIRVRLQKAKEMLERSSVSVKEVSLMAGYDNPFYFSRLFKKSEGISPEAYHLRKLSENTR